MLFPFNRICSNFVVFLPSGVFSLRKKRKTKGRVSVNMFNQSRSCSILQDFQLGSLIFFILTILWHPPRPYWHNRQSTWVFQWIPFQTSSPPRSWIQYKSRSILLQCKRSGDRVRIQPLGKHPHSAPPAPSNMTAKECQSSWLLLIDGSWARSRPLPALLNKQHRRLTSSRYRPDSRHDLGASLSRLWWSPVWLPSRVHTLRRCC
jgi:hypothetical protein